MKMTKKGTFLRELQEAFANSHTSFVANHVTDDIQWTIVGDRTITGKEAFVAALKEMEAEAPMELTIDHIICQGDTASVNGTIGSTDGTGKTYAYCDIFLLSGVESPKVKELTSYVIEVDR